MKPKSLLMLLVAAGGALVASFGVSQMNKEEPTETVKILVAKAEVPPHIPLTEEFVEFSEFPPNLVPLGAVKSKEEYERRALRAKAFPGQPIVKANLGEPGDFDASTEIPEGYRIYTSPITLTSSHSGQIRPKDRVDIYITYKDHNAGKDILKTKLILEYVEIFSMGGERAENTPGNKDLVAKNVSFLVTPNQAAILMMAESRGDLHFALRPKYETAASDVEILTEEDFDNLGTAKSLREKIEEEYQADMENLHAQLSEEHAAELRRLEEENQRLQRALQAEQEETLVAQATEPVEPIKWKIRIVNGTGTEESEFLLGEAGNAQSPAEKADVKEETQEETTQEETSTLPSAAAKNPMQTILNRLFEGS
ncbi:MAG: Flp pilus assembly protein CpaB [Planctomycetaceae bacterium]|nr:Flp pilus assembly protein CpaB [Planctomycetaceae bacterium]